MSGFELVLLIGFGMVIFHLVAQVNIDLKLSSRIDTWGRLVGKANTI